MNRLKVAALASVAFGLLLTGCTSAAQNALKSLSPSDSASSASSVDSASSVGSASSVDSATAGSTTSPAAGGSSSADAGSTTPARTSAPAASATRGGSTSAAACAASQLVVDIGRVDQGAGQLNYPIEFQNQGAACTLQGFPGVAMQDVSGNQVLQIPRDTSGGVGATVTVAQGQKVHAVLNGHVPGLSNTEKCGSWARELVTPPNTTTSSALFTAVSICDPKLEPVTSS